VVEARIVNSFEEVFQSSAHIAEVFSGKQNNSVLLQDQLSVAIKRRFQFTFNAFNLRVARSIEYGRGQSPGIFRRGMGNDQQFFQNSRLSGELATGSVRFDYRLSVSIIEEMPNLSRNVGGNYLFPILMNWAISRCIESALAFIVLACNINHRTKAVVYVAKFAIRSIALSH